MKLGDIDINDCKLGTTQIAKVMRGEHLIWPEVITDPDSIEAAYIGSSTAADSYSIVRTLEVSPDGKYIYVTSRSPEMIRQFEVTNPLDITEGVTEIASVSHSVSDPRFLRFSPDGTKLFFGLSSLKRWNLSTPWDITTGSEVQSLSIGLTYGGCFSEDGTRLFTSRDSNALEQWNLSTAWDLSTAVKQTTYLNGLEDFLFFDEGKIGMSVSHLESLYYTYKFETPYEPSTATLTESKDFAGVLTANGTLAIAKAKDIKRFYAHKMNQGSYSFINV